MKKNQPSSIPKIKMSTMDDCSHESAHISTTHSKRRTESESEKEHHRTDKELHNVLLYISYVHDREGVFF